MTADDLITTSRTVQAASTGSESTDRSADEASGPADDPLGTSPGLVD
jgi:hypothetical protein